MKLKMLNPAGGLRLVWGTNPGLPFSNYCTFDPSEIPYGLYSYLDDPLGLYDEDAANSLRPMLDAGGFVGCPIKFVMMDPKKHMTKLLKKEDLVNCKIYEFDGDFRVAQERQGVHLESDPVLIGVAGDVTEELFAESGLIGTIETRGVLLEQDTVVLATLDPQSFTDMEADNVYTRYFISTDNFKTAQTIDRRPWYDCAAEQEFVFFKDTDYQIVYTFVKEEDLEDEKYSFETMKADPNLADYFSENYYTVNLASSLTIFETPGAGVSHKIVTVGYSTVPTVTLNEHGWIENDSYVEPE